MTTPGPRTWLDRLDLAVTRTVGRARASSEHPIRVDLSAEWDHELDDLRAFIDAAVPLVELARAIEACHGLMTPEQFTKKATRVAECLAVFQAPPPPLSVRKP